MMMMATMVTIIFIIAIVAVIVIIVIIFVLVLGHGGDDDDADVCDADVAFPPVCTLHRVMRLGGAITTRYVVLFFGVVGLRFRGCGLRAMFYHTRLVFIIVF